MTCQHNNVEVCELVPQYWKAKVINGRISVIEETGEFFYDGAETDGAYCRDCCEKLAMPIDWLLD